MHGVSKAREIIAWVIKRRGFGANAMRLPVKSLTAGGWRCPGKVTACGEVMQQKRDSSRGHIPAMMRVCKVAEACIATADSGVGLPGKTRCREKR